MAATSKTQKYFEKFLHAMEHLYDSVSTMSYIDPKYLSPDDWNNIAVKCDKLANEFDRIYDNIEGLRSNE